MKKFKMPSAFTILFLIIIIVAISTWIIPAGEYNMNDDNAPIPGTYHTVDSNPQSYQVVSAPINGFFDAKDVCLFILVIGGFLGIVMKTGAIDAGISNVVHRMKGREKLMIPILMGLFALGGTSYGMAEETIAFYPLVLPIFIAAGYDAVTAVSVILVGAGVGCLGSTANPFATGIASGFAGINLSDGLLLRVIILIVSYIVAVVYVMKYAAKVKADPSKSLVADMRESNIKHFTSHQNETEMPKLNFRRKVALFLFAITFIIMIYSVIPFDKLDLGYINLTSLPALGWWFPELSALFLVSGIILGIICGLKEKEIVDSFIDGAKDLLSVALIIGVSRGITYIMNNGNITATILNYGENSLSKAGAAGFTVLTYIFYFPLSLLVPSTSGLATLSMPIMAPLGDFSGVARDIVVTAFQSASGIINLLTPTSGVVMGALAIGRVPYGKWIKYVIKLVIILTVVTGALLVGWSFV
ncbi:YfcC family protein [Clostridiaceae bacterium M8S5]|nr:YfcC family protein [Clostridiaceae bacterium M8S5]